MSTLNPTLAAAPAGPATHRSNAAGVAPLVRLLAAVALASAAAGGAATFAFERLIGAMEPPRPAPAAQAAATPLTPEQASPGLPAVHDVLRDRAEPPIEPPPAP